MKEVNWEDRTDEKMMWYVREFETFGISIRNKIGIKKAVRLLELQLEVRKGNDIIPLYKPYRELLGDYDGLNVDKVTNYVQYNSLKNWTRFSKKVNGYEFVMKFFTVITPLALLEEKQVKDYRSKIMEEKKLGTYDENTYKKYKTEI